MLRMRRTSHHLRQNHNPKAVPSSTAPHMPIKDKHCCQGMVSITADKLDAYQDIPYGTTAWKQSYGRRNPSEKTFSMIKDKGGLKPGWCRSFGLAAHTLGALALAIGAQPQTNPPGRKNPNRETPPASGQAQEHPAARRTSSPTPHTPGAAQLDTPPHPQHRQYPHCRL